MRESEKAYLGIVFVGVAAALVAIASFNWLVDPYDIYRTIRKPGVNLNKPGHHVHDRMVKAHIVEDVRPDFVMLGTSRTLYGMDPDYPPLRAVAGSGYNLGLLGISPYLALRYLQHAHQNHPVRTAFLGLDAVMFNLGIDDHDLSFAEERLAVAPDGSNQSSLIPYDFASTLLSVDALRLSAKTLRKQSAIVSELTDSGMRNPEVLYQDIAAHGGMRSYFNHWEKNYLEKLRCVHYFDQHGRSRTLDHFRSVIDYVRAQNIQLHLYISPAHARMNEVMRISGKYEAFEKIKKELVEILAEDAKRHPDKAPIELWDFSGANEFTTEAVPVPGDKQSQMLWYWEASHFRASLGDLVISRLLHLPAVPYDATEFGVLLNTDNIEHELARMRHAQDEYAASHPDDVAEIIKLHKEVEKSSGAMPCLASTGKAKPQI